MNDDASNKTPYGRLNKRADCQGKNDLLLVNALSKSDDPSNEISTPRSSNQLFCDSIVEIFNKLSSRNNRLARVEIQQVLLKYKFHDDCWYVNLANAVYLLLKLKFNIEVCIPYSCFGSMHKLLFSRSNLLTDILYDNEFVKFVKTVKIKLITIHFSHHNSAFIFMYLIQIFCSCPRCSKVPISN